MANADRPFGLWPRRHRSGAPYNGAANPYFVPSTDSNAMYLGDPVVVTGTSNTSTLVPMDGNHGNAYQPGTVPAVQLATAGAGNDITGVIIAVEASPDSGLKNVYRPASTEAIVWVADDPDLVFEAQEDSDGGALAATDVGQNVDLVSGSGSTVTGYSGWELDSSTAGTGSTIQMRLERLVNRLDNEIGNQAKWEVSILQHSRTNKTGV